jgi:uncharacterized OB-fold protein
LSSARYWREIPQRYRLEVGKCRGCGKAFFPPRMVCDQCGSREFETVRAKDEGTILTHTVIRVPPSELSDEAPYAVGIVELDEGPRITTQIADCDFDELAVGKRVRIEFRKISEEGKAGVICYGYKAVLL